MFYVEPDPHPGAVTTTTLGLPAKYTAGLQALPGLSSLSNTAHVLPGKTSHTYETLIQLIYLLNIVFRRI